MPTLLIFDDDKGKCDVAPEVAKCLPKGWHCGFCTPMSNKVSFDEFLDKIKAPAEAVVLVDIEIKRLESKGKDWRRLAAAELALSGSSVAERQKQLANYYGSHADYQLSLSLIAYLVQRGICFITISTQANRNGVDHNIQCASKAGLPLIGTWPVSFKTLLKPTDTLKNLASAITREWEKHSGSMRQRLWPFDTAGWFENGTATNLIPHSFTTDLKSNPQYQTAVDGYVAAVTQQRKNAGASKQSDCVERRHDALKTIVGAVAKAHSGKGRPPQMNVVALLAAAWDPTSAKWFSNYKWEATKPLMREAATQEQLIDAVLAIGGEDGLFEHLLRQKPKSAKSTVKEVSTTDTSVAITLSFDLSKDVRGGNDGLMQKFREAKENNCEPTGDTAIRLFKAWLTLGEPPSAEKRFVDIEVTNTQIIFRKI